MRCHSYRSDFSHKFSEFPLFKALLEALLDIKGDNILMTGALPEPGQATQISMDDLMSSTFKLTDFGAGMS
jgi:hypothetical protein